MASEAPDHLSRLPAELLCLVVENGSLSTGDLAALAATCRRCYILANPILYQKHLKENAGIALIWAVERGRFGTITRLLENGADINDDGMFWAYVEQKETLDAWNVVFDWNPLSIFTPLALAAALGSDNMVTFLLDHGADVEQPGKGLCTCANGENCVGLNFPPLSCNGGAEDESYIMDLESEFAWAPLHLALCRGHQSTAILLMERGADPRGTCPGEAGPWNALHTATRLKQENVINYILDNNVVDINEGGHEGLTPLLLAYYEGHYHLVDRYINLGADINAVWKSSDGGWTIFAMACLREEWDRISYLLRLGADPDFVLKDDEYGDKWTALGLIYGGLYGDGPRKWSCSCSKYVFDTDERIMVEQQIIQAKVDKAVAQRLQGDAP
ncbi:hypothetical protein KVR01_012468 [Diaporthe batatas]|uniref:uncharacterized protein n=1 Tax=Diaporthe batatas TaxID=748121 RepID=UPI001D05604A|nr:uncharacterized protein KVR01_012468 [Diaporthe batatas]KAG8157806.1 hypothetical protein KVR01_012468 [Diaporthe batatas]